MENGQESSKNKGAQNALEWTLLAATAFTLGTYLFCEIYSLDIWWHLAIGMDILEKGIIPRLDFYTVAGLGREYHDSHWLFQVMVALAHKSLGWIGIQGIQAVLWAGTLFLSYRSLRRWIPVSSSLLLVIMLTGASFERFLPRPEVVSFLMISVFLFILRSKRRNTPLFMGLLFILQVVWSNCHGLFVIGPFMAGIFLLWDLVSWKTRQYHFPIRSSICLGLVLLGTLCTPYGFHAWEYSALLFKEASSSDLYVFNTLGELRPTLSAAFFTSPAFWFFLVILAFSVLGLVSSIRERKLSAGHLILLSMLALAFTGRRNVVLFCIVAVPLFVEAPVMTRVLGSEVWRNRFSQIIMLLCILGGAWFSLSGVYYLRMEFPARTGAGITPSFFPHGLQSFVEAYDFQGSVLNSNTLGGFWLYARFPESLPLTDGRWEVQDPANLEWILQNSRNQFSWKQVAERYKTTGVLLAHTSPEAAAILPSIRTDPVWKLVYLDRAASFWVNSQVWPGIPALNLRDPEILPDTPRIDDALIMDPFLDGIGDANLRIENLKRAFTFGWQKREIGHRLGMLQIESKDYTGAEATFKELIRDDPIDAKALNELAFLRYLQGDYATAMRYMDQALEIDPANSDYLQNRQRIMDMIEKNGNPNRKDRR